MTSFSLDKVGMSASTICAIHCAVMPMLITFLPLVGLSFLASEWMEWGLFISVAILGTSSLCMGYRRHRSKPAFGILSTGLALIAIGRILHEGHLHGFGVACLVVGGLVVASAHGVNMWLCHRCPCCGSTDA